MIKTLSLQEAIEKCPAINATQASPKASKSYSFISTREILDKALSSNWLIRDIKVGRGNGPHGVHSINLVHEKQLLSQAEEGFPHISIINSHDLSKRFTINIGFFRLICSNGLIAPLGLCNNTSFLHRKGANFSADGFTESLSGAFDGYNNIISNINKMKDRNLSDMECNMLARYAHYIRFRYRMTQPKKFDYNAILKPRREADASKNLWTIFNVIQENITKGGTSIGKGIVRFQDDIKFNQELWTGVDTALNYSDKDLESKLKTLFPKTKRQKDKKNNCL